jgi:hypothetical protein
MNTPTKRKADALALIRAGYSYAFIGRALGITRQGAYVYAKQAGIIRNLNKSHPRGVVTTAAALQRVIRDVESDKIKLGFGNNGTPEDRERVKASIVGWLRSQMPEATA